MDEELLGAFQAESSEIIEALEQALRLFIDGRSDVLDEIFRHVHTLKGSASIVGLSSLEEFTHAWESRLDMLRSGKACWSSDCSILLLNCLQIAEELCNPEAQTQSNTGSSLSDDARRVLDDLSSALAEEEPEENALQDLQVSAPEQLASTAVASAKQALTRVSSLKLEQIQATSAELTQMMSELGGEIRRTGDSRLLDQVQSIYHQTATLYRKILAIRMVNFNQLGHRFLQAINDIAREKGQTINFKVTGAETEIDKTLADNLFEVLLHAIRNAADHGIEEPAQRLSAQKSAHGTITLQVKRLAGKLLISVTDDGKGIDPELIRQKAIKLGTVDSETNLKRYDDEQLLNLLVLPGFTLSEKVSKWSGRGVGMDVVHRKIRNLNGSLELQTTPGKGFRVEIRLPLNLSMVEGFIIRSADADMLIPIESVVSFFDYQATSNQKALVELLPIQGSLTPVLDLGILQGRSIPLAFGIIILVKLDDQRFGLLVDEVGDSISTAVRPMDQRLAPTPGIGGLANLGDGRLALVLDINELLTLISKDSQVSRPAGANGASPA